MNIEKETKGSQLLYYLETLSKPILIIIGFLYVTGIISLNIYLFQIGVADFSILKIQYIYCGVIIFFPIFLFCIIGLHFVTMVEDDLKTDKHIKYTIIGIGIMYSAIIITLFFYNKKYFVFSIIILLTIIFNIHHFLKWTKSALQKIYFTIFGLFFAFIYIVFCSTYFLPFIPPQFGGMKATNSIFFFKEEVIGVIKNIGIPLDKTIFSKSMPIKLIYETNNDYVISLNEKKIIRIKKELVYAIETNKKSNIEIK